MTEVAERPAPAPPSQHLGLRGNPTLTLVAISLGVMMVALDGTVVSVANPTIQRDLNATLAGLQWVTNGYLLALAVLLIPGGKLGDRFGRRRMFAIGIAGFALASLGCALSSSIGVLVCFRVIQGVSGAMLMPNTLAILRATFPPTSSLARSGSGGRRRHSRSHLGPIVGGLLVEHISWESIFLLNLPLGAIALTTTLLVVKESTEPVHERFDFPGLILLTAGLSLLVWALIKAQSHAFLSAYVLSFGIAGLLGLAAFAIREARARWPMLPLDIFRSRSVSAGTLLVIIGFMGLFGVLFFVTLYLQNVHHYSAVQTGVKMLPLTATFIVSPILGSVLTQRLGPRPPVVAGMLLLAAAFFGLTGLEVDSAYSAVWPWFVCIGLALGLIITSTTQAIVGNVSVDRGGIAGGLQTTANQLGGVLGTSVLGSILVSSVGSVLGGELAKAGVHGQVAQTVLSQKDIVGSGIAPVSAQMPASLQQAITDAANAAFLHGLRTAMIVAGCLSIIGALLGLLVERGSEVDPVHAVAA